MDSYKNFDQALPKDQSTGDTVELSQNLSNQNQDTHNQYKLPPKIKKTNVFVSLARFLMILFVLVLFLISSVSIYILVNPTSTFSKLLVEKTFISNFLELKQAKDPDQTSFQETKESKIVNKTLGLEEPDDKSFNFTSSAEAVSLQEAIQKVLPSVISINVEDINATKDSQLTSGTGFIVRKDGLVITNKHIVFKKCGSAKDKYQLIARDKDLNVFKLKLLSIDPVYDLAILQIIYNEKGKVFSPVNISSNQNLKLGMEVLAVGNALGQLPNTVTKGILSGLDRSIQGNELEDKCNGKKIYSDGLIQTDAAISKGNSGGPLFDPTGSLIGVNTFGAKDGENIGLAIPSTQVLTALNSFQENNQILRPSLKVETEVIDSSFITQNDWLPTNYGEIITSLEKKSKKDPKSQLNQSGLNIGDIILSVDGEEIITTPKNPSPLKRKILTYSPDQEITLEVRKVQKVEGEAYFYEDELQEIKVKLVKDFIEL